MEKELLKLLQEYKKEYREKTHVYKFGLYDFIHWLESRAEVENYDRARDNKDLTNK